MLRPHLIFMSALVNLYKIMRKALIDVLWPHLFHLFQGYDHQQAAHNLNYYMYLQSQGVGAVHPHHHHASPQSHQYQHNGI